VHLILTADSLFKAYSAYSDSLFKLTAYQSYSFVRQSNRRMAKTSKISTDLITLSY